MAIVRSIISLALFVVCFYGAAFFCYKQTGNFFLYPIPKSLAFHEEWEVEPLEKKDFNEIFNQPYYYLGKGHQCFVFSSKDQQFVLKFPFHSSTLPPLWKQPFGYFAEKHKEKAMRKTKMKLVKDAKSYLIAYRQFKEESGVVFLHLNRTETLQRKIDLFDKIGVRHTVELDAVEFIVQRRADLFYPQLKKWMEQGQEELAKKGISDLFRVFSARFAKGLDDPEQIFLGNYGFINGKAVQIDIGRLKEAEYGGIRIFQRDLISRLLAPLKEDLKNEYPELYDHMEKEWNQFLNPI